MTPEQLRIDCEALAAAGDPRAKATLALFAERDILRREVKNYQGTIDSIAYIVNHVVNEIQVPGLATVASTLPLSNKKDLITAAAKIEAGAKPEEIPELKGIDPKIFEANTDRPAGYRSEDSKRSGY